MSDELFETDKVYWKLSAKWANKKILCTDEGVEKYCHGNCCVYKTYFPKDYPNDTSCAALTEKGCSLSIEERPICCLIFPFTLKNNTLQMQLRIVYNPHRCDPCIGKGEKTILENLALHFTALFGEELYQQMIVATKRDQDFIFPVDKSLDDRIKAELGDFDYKSSRNPRK